MTIATLLTSVIITILPVGSTIPTLGECNWTYAGGYEEQSWTIYVCYNANEEQVEFVKYHELGHHFWFKFMTQAQRDEYTKEWKKSKVFYRDYGSTNAVEDFADNFSIHVLKLKHDKALDKRIYLIRKYLK